MSLRSILISAVIFLLIIGCKTITVSDNESVHADIPNDIELVPIPAGNYLKGEHNTTAVIPYDYDIMKYPVTNEQYLRFLYLADSLNLIEIDTSGAYGYYSGDQFWPPGNYKLADFSSNEARIGYYPPDYFFTKWRYVENRIEDYSKHPVTFVTWFGAKAFAAFYGMRLPTNEEWEKAARANTINRYPWGNKLSPEYANYKDSGDIYDNDTTPVGHYNGDGNTFASYSPYGIYDMAGNVWEWTNSWWQDSQGKIIKGGSFNSSLNNPPDADLLNYRLMTWFVPGVGYLPMNTSREIGFRCVRDLSN